VHREAANILAQSIRRETAILESVTELGASSEVDQGIVRGRAQLEALGSANTAALASVSRARAASMALAWRDAPRSTVEMRLQTLIPTRSMTVRGPVNIFRPEYGRTWLAEKVGGTGAIDALAVAKAGRYVWYELVNFVDGKRSLLDIRDAVSAEYGQIDAAAVEEYFRLLERAGVVSISAADPARPSRGPQHADFARWGGSSHREEKAPSAWRFSAPRGLRYHAHVARARGRMHQPLRAHA
jgi:hypothetical protein